MKLLLLTLMLSFSLLAQAVYVGGGPSAYATTLPNWAANLIFGVCTRDASTCNYTNWEGRGSAKQLSSVMYSVQTGVYQRIASTKGAWGGVDMFGIGLVGGSVSGTAASGALGLGGGLSYHPTKGPNWSFSAVLKTTYAPVNPGWQPVAYALIGYTFHAQ